jgi:NADPH:quinone reductase-like Zn-dependent oxidoreductase
MPAVSQDGYGTSEVLQEVRLPKPVPVLSEILVAVQAVRINPTDWWNRAQADALPLAALAVCQVRSTRPNAIRR